jgi:uncharacterized membrane protein YedE/YeeE
MAVFAVVLCLIFALGMLAQRTGLCMVRGVNEWKNGDPTFLLAILASGVLAWVAVVSGHFLDLPLQFRVYEPSVLFCIGGILFGIGAAFNQGCGVSTLTKLSRGELSMSATVAGWLVGWTILATWRPEVAVKPLPLPTNATYGMLIVISLLISVWALYGDLKRKKLWFGMMGIGLLGGFIFLYQPKWPPSGLLHDLSRAIIDKNDGLWPSMQRYALFICLLMGMFFAAWRAKRFVLVLPQIKHWIIHLLAGTLMGIGASLAMGGNDSQLLLALPTFSLAGMLAVAGIIVGLFIGLNIRKRIVVS